VLLEIENMWVRKVELSGVVGIDLVGWMDY